MNVMDLFPRATSRTFIPEDPTLELGRLPERLRRDEGALKAH